jgi:mannose/cellobiose epimerase-like protein (N-acyl-D-glucosamine 2-epimerase family)
MTLHSSSSRRAPPELVEWMKRYGGVAEEAEQQDFVEAALRALKVSLARPGRDREAAYALLAADGLMTYAVELMATAEDPEARLWALVESVATGSVGAQE